MATRRRRPGRPTGATGTREAILSAALRAFLTDGYQGTTLRKVAEAAGVDQSLVLHYHGSKDGLFAAALRSDTPITEVTALIGAVPVGELGRPLVAGYLRMWERPEVSARIRALVGAAALSTSAAEMVAAFLGEALTDPLAEAIARPDAAARANLVASHLFGTAAARYLLRVPPLASPRRTAVVDAVAPVIQHYLTGELPGGLTGEPGAVPAGAPRAHRAEPGGARLP